MEEPRRISPVGMIAWVLIRTDSPPDPPPEAVVSPPSPSPESQPPTTRTAALMASDRYTVREPIPQKSTRRRVNRQLRARVFAAYGRRCCECGGSDVPLEVHHVNGDPSDNRLQNTIPLCREHHRKATFPGI
jgi:hypothetical protein